MIDLKVTEKEYANVMGEYEGKPTLTLQEVGNTSPFGKFTFGLGKAIKIMDSISDIKAFVEKNVTQEYLAEQAKKAIVSKEKDAIRKAKKEADEAAIIAAYLARNPK